MKKFLCLALVLLTISVIPAAYAETATANDVLKYNLTYPVEIYHWGMVVTIQVPFTADIAGRQGALSFDFKGLDFITEREFFLNYLTQN